MKYTATAALSLLLVFAWSCGVREQTPTYCNPLDLDYGWGAFQQTQSRAAADPVIVLFKDRYYLFSTHDTGGYRVSDDLVHWHDVAFCESVRHAALDDGRYVAPAVAADDHYMYFIRLNRNRKAPTTEVIRSADPDSGEWEVCGEVRRISDPALLVDDGRMFLYHGLGTQQAIRCFEVDPATFREVEGSERILKSFPDDIDDYDAGYHFGRRELYDEIDARDWGGRFRWLPSPEGAWCIRRGDKYYMQYATPGTICIWYADAVMTADSPDGPFTEADYNPVSLKAGGFIGGAGHSCVFEDRYGNWWEITSMWVGNTDPFERRLGLFPVSFDAAGRMKVHTRFGDYPMRVPQRRFDPEEESSTHWNLLSYARSCTASSSLEGHGPELAADENVRTWWSAATGDAGEWFCMDLGRSMRIEAMQVNFAEQDADTTRMDDDFTAYRILTSKDGRKWSCTVDESKNRQVNPHRYIDLKRSVEARYVKVECVKAMLDGRFAIRDLRLFGDGMGDAPSMVPAARAVRDRSDERFATVEWERVEGADGYLICFGCAPDFLNLTVQVKGNERDNLLLHILRKGVEYWYRVDAYNDSGVACGRVFKEE